MGETHTIPPEFETEAMGSLQERNLLLRVVEVLGEEYAHNLRKLKQSAVGDVASWTALLPDAAQLSQLSHEQIEHIIQGARAKLIKPALSTPKKLGGTIAHLLSRSTREAAHRQQTLDRLVEKTINDLSNYLEIRKQLPLAHQLFDEKRIAASLDQEFNGGVEHAFITQRSDATLAVHDTPVLLAEKLKIPKEKREAALIARLINAAKQAKVFSHISPGKSLETLIKKNLNAAGLSVNDMCDPLFDLGGVLAKTTKINGELMSNIGDPPNPTYTKKLRDNNTKLEALRSLLEIRKSLDE